MTFGEIAVSDEEKPIRQIIARVSIVVFFLLTPFIPLLLALLENLSFGTNKVEGFCKQIGIHDELSILYDPVVKFLMGW
jgi:hypothetical protein